MAGINSGVNLSASEGNSQQDAVPEHAWRPPRATCIADTWGGNGNGGTEIAEVNQGQRFWSKQLGCGSLAQARLPPPWS